MVPQPTFCFLEVSKILCLILKTPEILNYEKVAFNISGLYFPVC